MKIAKTLAVEIALGLSFAYSLSAVVPISTSFGSLPNNRGYELVSRVTEPGGEDLLDTQTPFDASQPFFLAVASGVVDWESLGTCCEATAGGLNTYQAERGASGWQSKSITPVPAEILMGLEGLQEAVAWNGNLSQTLLSTSASYAPGDQRASGSGGSDLYLRGPTGGLTWVSQGSAGSGAGPYSTRFTGATPSLSEVAFTTAEPLTTNATGLAAAQSARYLYVRDVERESTSLVDVDDSGKLLSPYGASLGDSGPPKEGLLWFGFHGSSTNAISEDGSKVFFETPPAGMQGLPKGVEPHLYMRDLANETTTPLDDPTSSGSALYQGAATSGSLVFFTSDEGLDGAPTTNELYVFNTISSTVGNVPPMSSVPVAAGKGISGVTVIANDGSRVYFVADGVLATNDNSAGSSAVANEPNLYVYDTDSGERTFIATLSRPDVSDCKPTCAGGEPTGLLEPADIYRPAYASPSGSVFVFASSANLTGQALAPNATLTEEAHPEAHMISVTTTVGFIPNRIVAIDTGEREELDRIEKIDGPTQMTLSEYGPSQHDGLINSHQIGASIVQVNSEIYRYAGASGALTCVSCTPPGVLSTQNASLGEVGGGSYAPPRYAPQMSENGLQIFFNSPDPLVAGASKPDTSRLFEPTNLYEWNEGAVYLVANANNGGAVFHGTTPSGDDVIFTSRSALVPEAGEGSEHIYDARVNGGFTAEPPPTVGPCAHEACVDFSGGMPLLSPPASATLSEQGIGSPHPTLMVGGITAAQRSELARSGRLRLHVSATAPGEVIARVTAKLRARRLVVAHASATIGSSRTLTLTLSLDRAARHALATQGVLRLRVEVRYQPDNSAAVAELTVKASEKKRPSTRANARHA